MASMKVRSPSLVLGCALALVATAQEVLHSPPERTATPAARRNRDFARPSNAPQPEPAVSAVINLFDSYRVVGLSDLHGCAELLAFVDQLVRVPEFRSKVNDITWEPGNVRFQRVMDDFILRGRQMPYKELAQCWRNNTQSHTYSDTPALYELLRTIRSVNLMQPESRRLRVLLIDPPIDWSRIQSAADFRPQDFDRETHMAEVLEREVYAKGRKALFFAGGAHLGRGGGPLHDLEQSHPGTTFNIAIHEGFGERTEELESRLIAWPKPALARIRGTWWGKLQPPPSGDIFIGPDGKRVHPRQDQKIQDKWDTVLFLGKRKELTRVDPPGPNVLDDEWMAELRRRQALRGAPLFDLTSKNHPPTRQFFADDGPHGEQPKMLPLGKDFPGKPGAAQPRAGNPK
jgi:hypothetical protein